MRSDDAVETFKRHSYNKESTAEGADEEDGGSKGAVPELIRRHRHVKHLVYIPRQR